MFEKNFSREERAEISRKFREEIKAYGLVQAILTVMDSRSEKNVIKKTVLAQQCRKKDFAKKFEAACESIRELYPKRKFELRAFKQEILPAK